LDSHFRRKLGEEKKRIWDEKPDAIKKKKKKTWNPAEEKVTRRTGGSPRNVGLNGGKRTGGKTENG